MRAACVWKWAMDHPFLFDRTWKNHQALGGTLFSNKPSNKPSVQPQSIHEQEGMWKRHIKLITVITKHESNLNMKHCCVLIFSQPDLEKMRQDYGPYVLYELREVLQAETATIYTGVGN